MPIGRARVKEQGLVGLGANGPWAKWSGWLLDSLLSHTLKKINKTAIRKEKKERLGEEVGHADNFLRLRKMSLIQENRSGHGCKV